MPTPPNPAPNPTARARKIFWALVLLAALATGALSTALKAHPSPAAGATVAISGAILVVSLTLATRILLALDRARRTTGHTTRRSARTARRRP